MPDSPLVTAERIGSRRLVAAACPRAQSLGIGAGMAVAHAQAMVPGLHLAEAEPASDAAALSRLAAWCLRFSPLAAPAAPDGVWIEATGTAHLFGGERGLLGEVTGRLAIAGFACRAAIAGTPGAAHAMARHGPDPIAIVPDDGIEAALERLGIAALRLPEDRVAALRLLGFERIGQLMRTPRAPLARRFGNTPFTRLDQALGALPEPIEPIQPPGLPRARLGFPEPIATADDLHRALALLVHSLCEKLERGGQGASRLDLLCQRIDGTMQAIRIGTSAATRDQAHLLRLLSPQVEAIDPGFGIEHMTLTASLADTLGARQLGSGLAEAAAPDLTALVDTLMNRLGDGQVFRAEPVESDIPERSQTRIAPLARPTGRTWPDLPRPARLFDPPRPVQATALLPDHAPARFTWRGRPHAVRRADGPERVFGEWWKEAGETWSVRDYFQVEDEAGQRFWLFREGDGLDPDTGNLQWFLHGIFG